MFKKASETLLDLYVGTRETLRRKAVEQIQNQRGASAVEYALVIALVVVVVVGVAQSMGGPLQDFFKEAIDKLREALK